MMHNASKKIRYRKRKRFTWIVLLIVAIIGAGSLAFSVAQKIFFKEQVAGKILQERWLYWCADSPGAIQSPCYYVNQKGLVVDEAPRLQGTLFPKLYDERTTVPPISPPLLAFVNQFYQFGQFVMKNDETLEIGWPDAMKIKTTLKDDPKKVAENLALILEKEIRGRKDEVDYIDLRFGNRVYYKFR